MRRTWSFSATTEVYLDALDVERIPDPTTGGDFCRRFEAAEVETLMDAINETRIGVWSQQPAAFFDEVVIDLDDSLAPKIDGARFEASLANGHGPDFGAPAKAWRRRVGLHDLKYTFNESDESVAARRVENPYAQHFCGSTHRPHECPIHPTSLTQWRPRVGAERLETPRPVSASASCKRDTVDYNRSLNAGPDEPA